MKWVIVLILQMLIKKTKKEIKDETIVYYILVKYKQKGYYYVVKDISENVALVQLMDSLGHVNHYISAVG